MHYKELQIGKLYLVTGNISIITSNNDVKFLDKNQYVIYLGEIEPHRYRSKNIKQLKFLNAHGKIIVTSWFDRNSNCVNKWLEKATPATIKNNKK